MDDTNIHSIIYAHWEEEGFGGISQLWPRTGRDTSPDPLQCKFVRKIFIRFFRVIKLLKSGRKVSEHSSIFFLKFFAHYAHDEFFSSSITFYVASFFLHPLTIELVPGFAIVHRKLM